jgi:hypothetical protein
LHQLYLELQSHTLAVAEAARIQTQTSLVMAVQAEAEMVQVVQV